MELLCQVQNYEWGKKGMDSIIAQLQKQSNLNFSFDETLPYAELWMGTHVNAPSVVKTSGEPLLNVISKHPEYLGENVYKQFGELPFLFKVLSVNKALSIQAHPSKKHAEELHAKYPDIYKDPNHKPEMAVALTTFEALCGFRPFEEIKQFIQGLPELQYIIDVENIHDEKSFIPNAFKAVLTCKKDEIVKCIDNLLKRFEELDVIHNNLYLADLVKRLQLQFPYDNGILLVYFLNYLKLEPQQAIFLEANVPHAYLYGDCIECMACSDNVVRAGLTPKYVDIDTLCNMLTYKGDKPETFLFSPKREDQFSLIFKPPVQDFAIVQISIPVCNTSYSAIVRNSGSIFIVISGKAKYQNGIILPGTILFVPAGEAITFFDLEEDLLVYQALANN